MTQLQKVQRPRRPGARTRRSTRTPAPGIATADRLDPHDAASVSPNTQYAGRPIFGGHRERRRRLRRERQLRRRLGRRSSATIAPGQRIQVNVNGDAVFGPPGSDLFTTLDADLAGRARTTPPADHACQTTLDTQTNQVQNQLAQVGARFQRVQSMQSQNTSDGLTMKQNLSSIEDADLAQVMVNLQIQQVAYQAALSGDRQGHPAVADRLLEVGNHARDATATDVVEITFPAGLPGFPHAHQFELAPWGPAGSPFLMLSSSRRSRRGLRRCARRGSSIPTTSSSSTPEPPNGSRSTQAEDAVVFAVVTLRERPGGLDAQPARPDRREPLLARSGAGRACRAPATACAHRSPSRAELGTSSAIANV